MFILLAVAVSTALSAAPEPESKKIKLASPGIAGVNLPADRAELFSDHLAQELNARGIRVITAREVNAILGLARSQQLMGCDEASTSCMTELADALGVDGVIAGSVGKFGSSYTANINIVASGDGRLLGSVAVRADGEKQLLDGLTVGAQRAAAEVGNRLGKPVRRFVSQAVDVDVLDVLSGGLSLGLTTPFADRWSLFVKWFVTANQTDPDFEGLAFSRMHLEAQARYHLLERAPFGLYLGAGLVIPTITGYLDGVVDGVPVKAAVGGMGLAVSAEVGYGLVLFDFLHFGVGLAGFVGMTSMSFVSTSPTEPNFNGFVPLLDGTLRAQAGFAF